MGNYAWLTVETEDQIWAELNRRRQSQRALTRSVTPQQAANAAGLAENYPWLDPGVVQSLTLAGQGPDSPTAQLVAQTAATIGVEDGLFDEPASAIPDNQFDSLWDGISRGAGRGLLNLSRGAIAVMSAIPEEIFERVIPSAGVAAMDVDPLVDFGNLGDNLLADIIEAPGDIVSEMSKLLQGEFWDEFFTNLTEKASPSTLALTIGDIADPNRSPMLFGYDQEKGEGLIANFERRQQFRNRLTIPGVTPTKDDPYANTATFGRLAFMDVVEPGSDPYKFLSGTADFAGALVGPAAGLGKVAKGVQVAFGLGSRADIIAQGGRIGLLPGIKRSVDLDDAVNGFLTKPAGQRMVDYFTNETDYLRIWERTGRNGRIARELQKAATPEETIRVFQDNLGTTLREVPTAGPLGRGAGRVTGAVLGGRSGSDYGAIFGPGATLRRSLSNVRFTHDMPTGSFNPHNMDANVQIAHDLARTAKLGDEATSNYMRRIAELEDGDFDGLYDVVVDGLYKDIFNTLLESSSPLSRGRKLSEARKITRAWDTADIRNARAFFIDEAGYDVHLYPFTGQIGGVIHDTAPTVHLLSERLANSIPLADVEGIKRAANFYNRVWDIPGVTDSVAVADFLLGSAWKGMQLVTRIAYPVRVLFEEQTRLAGVEMNSMFRHPIDYLGWVVGSHGNGPISRTLRKGLGEQGGRTAAGDVFTEIEEFQAAMSRGSGGWAGAPGHIYTGRWDRVDKNHNQYYEGAATELRQLASDPLAQRVAGGLKPGDARSIGMGLDDPNVNTIDAIKEWYYSGTGQKFRKQLSEDPEWQRLRTGDEAAGTTARQESDAYVDSVVHRLNVKTGENPDLVQAVATGRLGDVQFYGKGAKLNSERKFAAALEEYDESLPAVVKVEAAVQDGSRVQQAVAAWDKATDRLFNALMSVPTNTLSRSPHFRQAYWNRMEELMGYADSKTQERIIRGAREAGLSESRQLDFARIATKTKSSGRLRFEDADVIARGHALDTTRNTLYDLTKRNQFFDSFRLVFPFGEAWKEILTAWTKILAQNPAMLRRGNQAIQGGLGPGFGGLASEYLGTGTLPGQGFFYEDSNGEMVFNYPGSVLASRFLLEEGGFLNRMGAMFDEDAAGFGLKGSLTGLNLLSATVFPGVGPTIQVPAAAFTEVFRELPDALNNVIFPYGKPPVDEGIGATIADVYLPAWADKIETAMADPDSHRLLANTVMDVMRALVRTGEYNTNSQSEIDRLYETAVERARQLFWIRGLAQSAAPTGPGVEWSTSDVQGNLVPTQWMVDEFYRLAQEEYGGDYDRANEEFIRRFGTDNLLALQGKTREIVPRPVSEIGADWVESHSELERRLAGGKEHSLLIGLLAPEGGDFDHAAYLQTINDGTREQLSPREMVALSNQYKGRIAYEQLKSLVAGRTDVQAQIWLAQGKATLAEQYPGFDDDLLLAQKAPVEDFIEEAQLAVNDPDLQGLSVTEGLRLYLEARTAAQAVVDQHSSRLNGSKGFTSSKSTQFLRDWLRATAEEIIAKHPDFAGAWQHVFQREIGGDE